MHSLNSGAGFPGATFQQNAGAERSNLPPEVSAEKREWSISEMARDFGLTLRALRFYETKGLIAPQRFGSTRFYTGRDRARLALILNAKKMGFTLGEAAAMLGKAETPDPAELPLSLDAVETQITFLERQLSAIQTALATLHNRRSLASAA